MQVEFDGGDRLVFYNGTYAALFTEVELQGESSWRGEKRSARPRLRQAKAMINTRDERGYYDKLLLDQTTDLAVNVQWLRGREYINQTGNEYDAARDAIRELARVRIAEALQKDPTIAKRAQIEHIEHRIKDRDERITRMRGEIAAAENANAADYTTLGQLRSAVDD